MTEPSFWDRPDEARGVMEEANRIRGWIEPWKEAAAKADELAEMVELLEAESDADLEEELERELGGLRRKVDALELRTMLQGENDHREAIVTIQAGAGGLDSQDWAQMLLRMYQRWAERQGFEVDLLDIQEDEEAGIKGATVEVRGASAYGYLRAEKGIHRLVRISPYDAQARRHTSFASVFVYPSVDDADIEVEINESDLKMDTFRASGAGGQHVNKTDSAVRLTHEPTGIVVSCQQERSQHKNRETAMRMLRAALYDRELQERQKEKEALEATKSDISWGNQIRSYVFDPYQMVSDHRTGLKVSNVERVLDGQLGEFIEAYLKEFGAETAA